MWFGRAGNQGGLYRWDGTTMTNLSTRLANRDIRGIQSLPDGSVMLATMGGPMLVDARGEVRFSLAH